MFRKLNKKNENKERGLLCNHNWNDDQCTLEILPIRRMVYPLSYTMQCRYCKEIICVQADAIRNVERFIKND